MTLICIVRGHKWFPLTKFADCCDRCPATRITRHPFDVV